MKLIGVVLLATTISGCAQTPLPEGTDNITVGTQWERIALLPNLPGVYKVVDTEDGVICYYTIGNDVRSGTSINCLAYYSGDK